jgi:hypothetical protein
MGTERAGIIAANTPAAAAPHTTKASTETLRARNAHILALAYLCAGALAASIAYCLFHLPFEIGDHLGNLLQLTDTTVSRIFVGTLRLQSFMRPMTWATMKVVFDASGGHYFLAFRMLHVASVIVLMFAFTRLTRVENTVSLCASLIATAAVMGMPAFHDTMNETELNTKLTLAAICLVIVNLSASQPRWWKDAAVLVLFVWALLTNELGLLLWVCVAGGYLVGFRGVSRNAVLAATALVAIYFYVRFLRLHVGTPALNERSSGFGFRILSADELVQMFGQNRWPFYAYNVTASLLSVLFSEPRAGVFAFVRDLFASKLQSGSIVSVATSVLSTSVMLWFIARRWRRWLRWELGYGDQMFLLSAAVIVANAVISFPYVKDVIMNIASVFYCLALGTALRELMAVITTRPLPISRAMFACSIVALISVGWTIRAASFYADMRLRAFKAQVDWVFVDDWLRSQHVVLTTPRQRALVEQLSTQMIAMRVPKVYLEPAWVKDLLTPD